MKPRKPRGREEVVCDVCGRPLLKAAAVGWGRMWLHPVKCFAVALGRARAQMDLFVKGGH